MRIPRWARAVSAPLAGRRGAADDRATMRVRRRGSGLVRTLVVATATIAILLVCFSIYQYAQVDATSIVERHKPRLPDPPVKPVGFDPKTNTPASLKLGQANMGGGRNVRINIWGAEGTRAKFEIAVRSWAPVEGAPDEYLLDNPEIRFRTSDGHAVRVTAGKGLLEAPRESSGLRPRRGRLSGDVLLEIDRLTERERAELPPQRQGPPDPSELLQVTMGEISFDLEYAKLTIPGDLHLWGRDVDLKATDLEVRFNEIEDRVEYFTVQRGGRIELRDADEQLGLATDGLGSEPKKDLTIVEWLRATIEAQLAAKAGNQALTKEKEAVAETETQETPQGQDQETLPVFRLHDDDVADARPPIHYFARFEGNVDARQLSGTQVQSRLRSDTLEIIRRFSAADRLRMESKNEKQPSTLSESTSAEEGSADQPSPETGQRVVLVWKERLHVESLPPDDPRLQDQRRSVITALGLPAELLSPEGQASGTRISFDPETSKVRLSGTERYPATVRSKNQGVLVGQEIFLARNEDALVVEVVGPGSITRDANDESRAAGTNPHADLNAGSNSNENVNPNPQPHRQVQPDAASETWSIRFAQRLDAKGRFVKKATLGLSGRVAIHERRVLDEAHFIGDVRLAQMNGALDADELKVRFTTRPARLGGQQAVKHIEAIGHVKVARGSDHLAADRLDMTMTPSATNGFVPRTVIAEGTVTAQQGERSLAARDTLTLDFATVEKPAAPFDAAKAYQAALKAGLDPTTIDWDAERAKQATRVEHVPALYRLRAGGDVAVSDPASGLDLTAEHLDCAIAGGSTISTAIVTGADDHPASVRLANLAVTGPEIRLNVPDEWAEVPGAGRMTFQSKKDLDGRPLSQPIPISVTWTEWMKYHGRENRSVFSGSVHAASQSSTTFDCRRLVVEFEDTLPTTDEHRSTQDWWIFQGLVDRITARPKPSILGPGASKQLSYLLATGDVVALTSEMDSTTGVLKSRASIRGPKLSLNLRDGVSKMLIEGAGSLLLEDFQSENQADPSEKPEGRNPTEGGGLFGVETGGGASKTLIGWQDVMWYDFSIDQTRFEGDIELKHFSGAELARIIRAPSSDSASTGGRSTFLSCADLTVDFHQPQGDSRQSEPGQRMGRMSAGRLQRFQASGDVQLEDSTEGLSLLADSVIYEKPRSLLAVYGTGGHDARIVIQKPGQFPQDISAERFFYNLSTHSVEVAAPRGYFRQR